MLNTRITRFQDVQNVSGSVTPRSQREQTADSPNTIRSRSNTPQAARAPVQPSDSDSFWVCCGGNGGGCPANGTYLAALHEECLECQHRRCGGCMILDVQAQAGDMVL
ncbi:uncharacterized protein LAJ45_09039 [Morchella importuna]|uniref:uncharacterized protein n=1 Tax=Morchella importuna TaxID=1174673 RepID=UPI001E8DA05B|nr:uncharacterized protein LAJ45_09039 [Morchella importuna]KAH8146959.1 hypothetical protein LAJ45_09039 [Morchella importuna]